MPEELRTAVSEDPDFAAGWSFACILATGFAQAADALCSRAASGGKASRAKCFSSAGVPSEHNDQIGAISN